MLDRTRSDLLLDLPAPMPAPAPRLGVDWRTPISAGWTVAVVFAPILLVALVWAVVPAAPENAPVDPLWVTVLGEITGIVTLALPLAAASRHRAVGGAMFATGAGLGVLHAWCGMQAHVAATSGSFLMVAAAIATFTALGAAVVRRG